MFAWFVSLVLYFEPPQGRLRLVVNEYHRDVCVLLLLVGSASAIAH